jgi:hypothetical protein
VSGSYHCFAVICLSSSSSSLFTHPVLLWTADDPLVAHAAECEYELVGVLCHQGEATAGHYYSYIRDRATGQWNEFNDSVRAHGSHCLCVAAVVFSFLLHLDLIAQGS